MKTTHTQNRILVIAIILSLLFHAGVIVYILLSPPMHTKSTFPSFDPENTAAQEELNKDDDGWATTEMRNGDFGTPTFFEDKAEDKQPETKSDPEQELVQEKQEEEQQKEIAIPELTQLEEPVIKRQRRTRPIREQREIVEPQKAQPAPTPMPPQVKQLPTLAQLTQGFLHSRENGQHAVSMIGNRNGRPTDEQLKYERYLQKLSWCLQNSFSINNDRYPLSHPIDVEVHLFFALNKDGSLKQLTLRKSSKNMQLDQFALFLLRDASTSFPPVPQYLPHDPFSITYIINFNTTEDSRLRIYRR